MIVTTETRIVKNSLLTSTALVAGFLVVSVSANAAPIPVVSGTFVGGEAAGSFANTSNKTTITVHQDNTIANFDSYNIGTNQKVHYQHDLDTRGNVNHLSRVTGGNESRILGQLTSDRVNVTLINPNGIFFGQNSKVNVPNLIASTTDISDENFKAGNYKFDIAGKKGAKITNNGRITIQDGGMAVFVAPSVENNGVIVANQGKVTLAAGDEFTLDMYGDKLVNFAVSDEDNARYIKQTGSIVAKDGIVALTVQDVDSIVKNSINNTGYIEANTVTMDANDIVLGRTSTIVAEDLLSDEKNTKHSELSKPSIGGGKIIIKAKNSLIADGDLIATGSGKNGNGGFIETSAKELTLKNSLNIDTSADNGNAGEWLIDPSDFTIGSGVGGANFINNIFLSAALTNNNITLQTNPLGAQDGDINVNASVFKVAGAQTTLKLQAADDINIASGVTVGAIGTRKLNVNLVAEDDVTVDGRIATNGGNFNVSNAALGNVDTFTNNGTINTKTGDVTIAANLIDINNTITGDDLTLNTGAAGRIELDAKLIANTLSSDTKQVDVISNKATINQGVQLVNAGGVVNLGADTFDQSVLVNKDITLAGDSAGGTIIAPTSQAALTNEFRSSYDWNEINKSIILVQNANANITGITVDGSGVATGFSDSGTEFERLVGIGYDNASGVVNATTVENITDDARGFSTGIFADSNSVYNDKTGGGVGFTGVNVASTDIENGVVVLASTIKDYQHQGFNANGDKLNGGAYGNTVTSPEAAAGIVYSRGTDGYIHSNTIDNDSTKVGSYFGNSSDILLDRAGSGILVENNTIIGGNGKGIGIQVLETNGATISKNNVQNETSGVYLDLAKNIAINENNIEGNTDGVVALVSKTNTLLNNTIKNNTNTGVSLLLSDATLTGDKISGGTTGLQVFGAPASTSFGAGVEFSGQSGQYLSLEDGAMDNLNLDATDVKFDGVKGGAATDVQLVAIEDKVHHELDDSNVGLVFFKDKTVVATKNNNGIQAAVDSADAGNTVLVGGGKYDEAVLINKNIILDGANGTGEVIIAPTSTKSLNEFRSSYDWNELNKSVVLVQNATVDISDITVDGAGVSTGLSDSGTEFDRLVGIGYDNASGTVDNVDVKNISDDTRGFSTGIFADSNSVYNDKTGGGVGFTGVNVASTDVANTVTVKNSSVDNYEYKGVSANGNLLTATVDTNTITSDEAKAGVALSRGTKGSVVNNTIDNDSTSVGSYFGNSSDILLDRAGADILVENNTIIGGNGKGIGIQVLETDGATISKNNVQNETSGVYLDLANNNNVNDNNVQNNIDGVVLLVSDNNNLSNNNITDNSNSGATLFISDNNNLRDNNIRRNGDGVYLQGSDGNLLARNDIINNDNTGVKLEGSDNNRIRNNDINRNTDGVALIDSDSNRLINNDIRNNSNDGIALDNSDDNTIFDNLFKGNTNGVALRNGSELNAVNGNRISNNNNHGVLINNSDNNFLNFNDIIDNTSSGVEIVSSDDTVVRGFSINGNNIGINVTDGSNNTIIGDSAFTFFMNDNGTGIHITDNSTGTQISELTLNNNGVGIHSENGANNTSITNTTINNGDIGFLVDGDNAPITLTMNNVIFGGTQTDSAITFQNATTVDGVVVNDIQLLSDAPIGWKFDTVEGGNPTDVLGAGDMNFGNTVFGDTYTVYDIELANSLMDGDASGVTFVNDGNDPFAREDRVHHTVDDSPEGTIFYNGLSTVTANFGNLFGNIARRVDLREVYYNPISTAGKTFDTPSIEGVSRATNFNATNDFRVSLSGGNPTAPVQVAANTNPSDLNNLETAANGGAASGDLNELETAAGGNTGNCGTNFANDFLGEDVLLADADGSCQLDNRQAQVQ